MEVHAPFSPSASERWLNCPASHRQSQLVPKPPTSQYAARGNTLHRMAALMITKSKRAGQARGYVVNIVLEPAETEGLKTYATFCKAFIKTATVYGVETLLPFSADLFGTCDFYSVNNGVLNVVDLKTGSGILVEAEGNGQLLTYAMMLLEGGTLAPEIVKSIHHVHLHVVQPMYPNAPSIRSVAYPRDTITRWKALVLDAIDTAKAADAPFHPGEHCRFCPAKPSCPALLGIVQALPTPAIHGSLTAAQISDWLTKADTIETWIAALREFAHGVIESGSTIPGWKLQDKRATRKWSDDAAVVATCKKLKIHAQELKLLSPAQLAKKHGSMPAELVKFIDQTPSGQNLVRDPASAGLLTDGGQSPDLATALTNLKYRV